MWWILPVLTLPASGRDVLLLGNSYTAFNELDVVVADSLRARPPWPDALVVSLTNGGWTLSQHLAVSDGSQGVTPWTQAFDSPWDVVVLQEQSQTLGFESTSPAWIASRDSAVELAELARSTGALPALHLTWGRRDGDSDNPTLYPDFQTMQDRLTAGALVVADAMAAGGDPVPVVPTGEVYRAVWQAHVDAGDDPLGDTLFRRLYNSDGSHPSPLGTWTSAATHHAALLGRDPSEVPVPWPGVDPADVALLADHVRAVVLAEPFGDYAYPWAHTWQVGERIGSIGSAGDRPVVRLDTAALLDNADLLVVGGTEGPDPADGELWLESGAVLNAATALEVGTEGTGVVRLSGGTLEVGALTLGAGATFEWTGGTLVTSVVDGDLQQGGAWAVGDGATIDGSWTMLGGEVSLGAGVVEATGPASLSGSVLLDDVTPRVLVRAATLDVSGADLALPEGLATRVIDEDTTQAWVLEAPDDPEETDDTVTPTGETSDTRGCACATHAPAATPWLAWLARRR